MALSSTLMLRPSGTARTISSARTVSVARSTSARGNSSREISPPSARRTVMSSSSCSGVWSGFCSPSTILLASRLKRDRRAVSHVEDDDSHRGCVDQGFQAGLGALFIPVPAGIGDHQGNLGGEHDQGLLVFPGELTAGLLLAQVNIAHALALVAYGDAEEGADGHWSVQFAQAHCPGMAAQVRHPNRARNRAEVFEEPLPIGNLPNAPGVFDG